MDEQTEHIDVFVSYARSDRARVRPMIDVLEASGWRVFWDHDIPPGWTWDEYIGARLETATVVLVLWSKESVGSEFVRTEAARARRRRAMVPARIDDVEPPVEFERVQAADLIDWLRMPEQALPAILRTELARRIHAAVGKKPAPEAVPAPTQDKVADVASPSAPPRSVEGPASSAEWIEEPDSVSPAQTSNAGSAQPRAPATPTADAATGVRKVAWRAVALTVIVAAISAATYFIVLIPLSKGIFVSPGEILAGALLAMSAAFVRVYGVRTVAVAIGFGVVVSALVAMALAGRGAIGLVFVGLRFGAGQIVCVALAGRTHRDSWWLGGIGILLGTVADELVLTILVATTSRAIDGGSVVTIIIERLVIAVFAIIFFRWLLHRLSQPQRSG